MVFSVPDRGRATAGPPQLKRAGWIAGPFALSVSPQLTNNSYQRPNNVPGGK
jgi:hypothetical protein